MSPWIVLLSLSILGLLILVLGTPLLSREFKMIFIWKRVPATVVRTNIEKRRFGFTLAADYDFTEPGSGDYSRHFGPEWGSWYPTKRAAELAAKRLLGAERVAYLDTRARRAYFSRKYDLIDKAFALFSIVVVPVILLGCLGALVLSAWALFGKGQS